MPAPSPSSCAAAGLGALGLHRRAAPGGDRQDRRDGLAKQPGGAHTTDGVLPRALVTAARGTGTAGPAGALTGSAAPQLALVHTLVSAPRRVTPEFTRSPVALGERERP